MSACVFSTIVESRIIFDASLRSIQHSFKMISTFSESISTKLNDVFRCSPYFVEQSVECVTVQIVETGP